MECKDSVCLHCTHVFDVNNLKNERRRKVTVHGDIDLVQIIAKCYDINEDAFQNFIGKDDIYVCVKCYNVLKTISTAYKKYEQNKEILKASASNDFKNVAIRLDCDVINNQQTSTLKRNRNCLTPSKTGYTPKSKGKAKEKRIYHETHEVETPSTSKCSLTESQPKPKTNRRKLNFFTTPNPKHGQSPGPKVKVHIGYASSSRNSVLKGPSKLACRALVMKQYRVALNHLMEIDEVKKDIGNVVRKKMTTEINKYCKNKDSLLRSINISSFTWKNAYKQLENMCPLTVEMFKLIAGQNTKNIPRLVSSIAVLLFTRNQQMNTLQAINSVLMFRGHVRTKVYTTFNRAGLCNSYKSTLNTVDKICEKFDLPVRKWSEQLSIKTGTQPNASVLDDHTYATPLNMYIAKKLLEAESPMVDKVDDDLVFPYPVGRTMKVSFPFNTDFIAALCLSLKIKLYFSSIVVMATSISIFLFTGSFHRKFSDIISRSDWSPISEGR